MYIYREREKELCIRELFALRYVQYKSWKKMLQQTTPIPFIKTHKRTNTNERSLLHDAILLI
jgi:hypothetical protein